MSLSPARALSRCGQEAVPAPLLSRLWPGPCCREEGENIWSQGRGTSPGKNAELLEEALTAAAGVEEAPASLLRHSCTGEGKLRHGGARLRHVGSGSRERQGHPRLPGCRSIAQDLQRRAWHPGAAGKAREAAGREGAARSPPPKDAPCHPPAGGWSRTVDMETGKHRLSG